MNQLMWPRWDPSRLHYWRIHAISENTQKINKRVHKRYDERDLTLIKETIDQHLEDAGEIYASISSTDTPDQSTESDQKINQLGERIKKLLAKKKEELSEEESEQLDAAFEDLLDTCGQLDYSFHSVIGEIKRSDEDFDPEVGMILLCKNVRIMEDLISKICSNNIEKSIIDGEKHFKSMRLGFEWLFCHNDINESTSINKLDIRDENRYLDYIKCMILIKSKSISSLPNSSIEIDQYFEYIKAAFDKQKFTEFKTIKDRIENYKNRVKHLTEHFFTIYELLVQYRDALFYEEEIRKDLEKTVVTGSGARISQEIVDLSAVAVRVLLDRFVSFVKINDLNFGNSTLNHSWFNYSELSKSNYAGSNFEYTRIENAKMIDCDISTCNLSFADAGETDFSHSNFNYSDLTGMNLIGAIVNYCDFQNAIFRDANIDRLQNAVFEYFLNGNSLRSGYDRIRMLFNHWNNRNLTKENSINKLISQLKSISRGNQHDLVIENENVPWAILEPSLEQAEISQIVSQMRGILSEYLKSHICVELLDWVKKRFLNAEKSAEKLQDKYGKVFLETAEMRDITAKYTQMNGCDLCHIDLGNATFEDANLSNTHMYYTKAEGASFIRTNLNQAECFESNFYSANMKWAVASGATFINCDLNNTNWNNAIIIRSNFIDLSEYVEGHIVSDPMYIFFLKIDQYMKKVSNTEPNDISMVIKDYPSYTPSKRTATTSNESSSCWEKNCSISDSTLNDVLADNTAFINITADRSSFNQASFKNTIFANCKMYLTDFISVDFRYSNLLLCCLGQSNFKSANFINSEIRYVDFSNSNLFLAMFNLCQMDHILFNNANLSEANLSDAVIRNCAFVNCNFEKINLTGTRFENCIFERINFNNPIGSDLSRLINCYGLNCMFNGQETEGNVIDESVFQS